MTKNIGGADRVVRIVAGLVIIGIGIVMKSWWGAIGLLLLVTGLFRFCLAYVPFGISTATRA